MAEKKKRPTPKIKKRVWKDFDCKKIGDTGENKFFSKYRLSGWVKGNKKIDFINVHTRETVELKSDTHSIEEVGNLFLEEKSNVFRNTPGGIRRAFLDGVDYFCYYFIPDNKIFWFKTSQLYNFVEKNKDEYKTKTVFNIGYDTQGKIIPITDVEELILKTDSL